MNQTIRQKTALAAALRAGLIDRTQYDEKIKRLPYSALKYRLNRLLKPVMVVIYRLNPWAWSKAMGMDKRIEKMPPVPKHSTFKSKQRRALVTRIFRRESLT